MVHIVGFTKEQSIYQQTSVQSINLNNYEWVWIDMEDPSQTELDQMIHTLKVHPESLEHQGKRVRRPKLEHFHDYDFYITHILKEKNNEILKEEIDFFVGENFIITLHTHPVKIIQQIKEELDTETNFELWSTHTIFLRLLTYIVNSYFPLIEDIEDALEVVEDNTDNKKMDKLMVELFEIRRMLLHISYTITPMKDMLQQTVFGETHMSKKYRKKHFTHLYDHLLKLSEMVMTNREITADIRDNYLSLNSYETNNLMTVLTIVASIFTPLTFIAGVYGMNFINMPELQWTNGYYIVLVVMFMIACAMFVWFKGKGWFK